MTKVIQLKKNIKAVNDSFATKNRELLASSGVMAINLMSSPGSGKTTLIEKTIQLLSGQLNIGVIEGDIATTQDADRVLAAGASQVVQINTEGACHLDASMIGQAMMEINLNEISLLIIENVGNLVCPAGFHLGENYKVMIASLTEGADKPKKYPSMYLNSDILIVNKIDLSPHLTINSQDIIKEAKEVNPHLAVFNLSATTGEGVQDWLDWILGVSLP